MLAPNHVSAPAAIHTSSMPLNDGTALLTSDGWTKIDDPTIVPTTIAVAWVRPIVRVSLADTARMLSGVRHRGYLATVSDTLHMGGEGRYRRKRIGFAGALVRPIALHSREAERHPAGILRAGLDLVERDLHDELRPHVDGVVVAPDLELEELLRLPGEHLVGHALEGLSEHDEPAALRIARAQMQIAERADATAAAPLRRQHDEIERPRLLHLQPCLAAAPRRVCAGDRLRHYPFVAGRERPLGEGRGHVGIRRHDPRHEVRHRALLVEQRHAA